METKNKDIPGEIMHKLNLSDLEKCGVSTDGFIDILLAVKGPLKHRALQLVRYTDGYLKGKVAKSGFWVSCDEITQLQSDESNLDESTKKLVTDLATKLSALSEESDIDLHVELRNLLKNDNALFSQISKLIEQRKSIGKSILGMLLRVAKRDTTCTFGDIEPFLEKSEDISQTHLIMILEVAQREPKKDFKKIKKWIKKCGGLNNRNFHLASGILRRDNEENNNENHNYLKSMLLSDA